MNRGASGAASDPDAGGATEVPFLYDLRFEKAITGSVCVRICPLAAANVC